MTVKIYPYKQGSRSARALAAALGARVLKRQGSRWRPRPQDVVINWGDAQYQPPNCAVLNVPSSVDLASNKVSAFVAMQGAGNVPIPEFTTDRAVAQQWITDGSTVVCRTLTRASEGRGIVISNQDTPLVAAPLYVKYVKKQEEYRLHVLNGRVFDVQRKMRNREVPDEEVNWAVRNHSNGFVFGREGVAVADAALTAAVNAIAALGLNFGAVDLIYNQRREQYYVLEVNTAPGLTGTTLDNYARAFSEVV